MSDKIVRHTPAVRATHWLVAVSGILLMFSGFGEMPMYKRYFVTSIPGLGWSGDYAIMLDIHYLTAAVFCGAVAFHLLYHFRRREFAILPKKGDVAESMVTLKAMLRGKKEPPHEKFLAEQRLAYAGMGVVTLMLVVTGLIKTYKNTGPVVLDPIFLNVVTYAHTLSTMLFMAFFFMHLGVFVLKANWPLLKSMFTGTVSRDYARERHGHWKV